MTPAEIVFALARHARHEVAGKGLARPLIAGLIRAEPTHPAGPLDQLPHRRSQVPVLMIKLGDGSTKIVLRSELKPPCGQAGP